MTYLELCQALRDECSVAGVGPDRVTGQTGTYGRLINWVRQAYVEIQNHYINWKFLHRWFVHDKEALLRAFVDDPNAHTIQPPEDLNVWVLESFKLDGQPIPAAEYHDRTFADRDQPCVVVMPDNSLHIQNLEEGVFPDLRGSYYCKPQVLTADNDVPWMPQQFHYLIVYRAMMMYGTYDNALEIKAGGIEGWQSMMPVLEANQIPLQSKPLMPNELELIIRTE